MAEFPDFSDPDKWKIYRHPDGGGVNVFATHVKRVEGEDGKVHTIRFDKERLKKIVERNNRRDALRQYCPLTLGHTVAGGTEKDQPDDVGYARDFELAYDKTLKKWVIRSVFYIDRDKVKEAEKYKRVSVEIYPRDNLFDPISLLKRTPQLDLGQWTYGRGGGALKLRYAMDDKGDIDDRFREDDREEGPPPSGDREDDGDDGGGEDERDMPPPREDEEEGRGPEGVDPDFHGNFMRCMKHYEMGKQKKGVGDGLGLRDEPPGRRAPPAPPARPEDRSRQMRKDAESIRFARLEKMVQSIASKTEAALAGLSDENKSLRYEKEEAVCERMVMQQVAKGTICDPPKEVARMIPMSHDERLEHIEYMRDNYRKDPVDRDDATHKVRRAVGSEPVRMSRATQGGEARIAARGGSESRGRRSPSDGEMDDVEQAEALEYMRANELCGEKGWNEALKAIRGNGNGR